MNDKQVILYGAGTFGIFAAITLSQKGITPICFCDKKKKGIEPVTELPIISLQTLKSDYPETQIIISAFHEWTAKEIYDELIEMGIDESRIIHYYSLYEIVKNNDALVYFLSHHNSSEQIKLIGSVLKDELKISSDAIYFRNIAYPHDVIYKFSNLFGALINSSLPCIVDCQYSRHYIDIYDMISYEGSYIMDEADCPMMIKEGDVVIDAGAWCGDFSLNAAIKFGATAYAFEPSSTTHSMLLRTIALNNCESKIIPVKAGLGSESMHARFLNMPNRSGDSHVSENGSEDIVLTTIDDFVAQNGIDKVDFIKADIEGFEREMLKGATKTLREFAPKLSLCTYHLPDDPIVLRKIISKANPSYKFEQRKKKLFAWVDM